MVEQENLQEALKAWAWDKSARYASCKKGPEWEELQKELRDSLSCMLYKITAELEGLYCIAALQRDTSRETYNEFAGLVKEWIRKGATHE
ncbi:MAG: hypothetical protein LBJ24_01795 [Treponema sp.]|jgi:hypothetical protein|nr:hypothetical protein [Treponema sp.]